MKPLFKKQLLETGSGLFIDRKKNRRRSLPALLGLAILYIYVFVVMSLTFLTFSLSLSPLIQMQLSWLYMAFLELVALIFSVLICVFMALPILYQSKDTEMLLSLPIRPGTIIAAKLITLYAMSLVFVLMVMLPALGVYWFELFKAGTLHPSAILAGLAMPLLISMLSVLLSCLLGWAVHMLGSRMPNPAIAQTIFSLLFLAVYLWGYMQLQNIVQEILLHALSLSGSLETFAPLVWFGKAACGNGLDLLLCSIISLLMLAGVWSFLSATFFTSVSIKPASAGKTYSKKPMKMHSRSRALFGREFSRLMHSSAYLLNSAFGSLVLLILAVAALFAGPAIVQELKTILPVPYISAAAIAALALTCGTVDLTAPSVSLEGRQIWLVQSLPAEPWQILKAKLHLHLLFALVPALLASLSLCIIIQPGWLMGFFLFLVPALWSLANGLLGLILNLKFPNLTWSAEVQPIKNSMSVFLSLMISMCIVILLGILCMVWMDSISFPVLFAVLSLFLAAVSWAMYHWLKTRGAALFAALQP